MSDDGEQFTSPEAGGPPPPPSGEAPPPPPAPSTDAPPAPGYDAPPAPGYDAPPAPGYDAPPAQGYDAPPQPGYGGPAGAPQYAQPAPPQPPAVAPMQNMAGSGVADDTGSGVIAHVLALFTGILGTGIFYAVSNDKSPFVRHHVAEALNFSITMAIAWMGTFVLMFLLIGFLIAPVLMVWGFVLPIMAAMAANKGEWYRYPATLRLVKGPMDQPGAAQGFGGGQSF